MNDAASTVTSLNPEPVKVGDTVGLWAEGRGLLEGAVRPLQGEAEVIVAGEPAQPLPQMLPGRPGPPGPPSAPRSPCPGTRSAHPDRPGLSNTEIADRLVVSETTVKATSTTCSLRQASAAAPKPSPAPTTTDSSEPALHKNRPNPAAKPPPFCPDGRNSAVNLTAPSILNRPGPRAAIAAGLTSVTGTGLHRPPSGKACAIRLSS
jgi:hypothetical protein